MKKSTIFLMSFLLALGAVFGAACGENDGDATPDTEQGNTMPDLGQDGDATPDGANVQMTALQWSNALAVDNFTNYTLVQTITTMEGVEELGNAQTVTAKITEDTVCLSGVIITGENEEIPWTDTFTGADAVLYKTNYQKVFLALLQDYENYAYDAATDCYRVQSAVTATFDEESFTEVYVMEQGTVSFDTEGKLLFFECVTDWTVSYKSDDEAPTTARYTMCWAFSDYGVTVAEG